MAYFGNQPADVALKVGSGVITATEIQDASIITADIANDAITANQIDEDGTGFQMGTLGVGASPSFKFDVQDNSGTWASRVLNTNAGGQALLVRTDATNDATALGVYANGAYRLLVTETASTFSNKVTIASTGLNAAPSLAIDNSSSSSYIHSIEALGANMTAGQTNIINLGKIGDAKNSGVIGYQWNGAGSNDNLLTFEHWGTGRLVTINGLGTTVINSTGANSLNLFRSNSGNVMQIGCTTVSDDASMYLRTNGIFNFHTPGSGQIRFSSGGSQALNLDASQNATFSGTVRSTNVFYGNDNGANNPGFRFFNAASGMYHAGSDNLGFAVTGNNVATFTASTATFAGDVTISKSNAKMTIFASNTGDHESLVFDRNTASNGDSQEIRWKLQGNNYPGGYILHEFDDANNSSLAFGVRDSGTPGTALSINSSKDVTVSKRLYVTANLDAGFGTELFNGHATGHGLKVRGGSTSSHYSLYVSNNDQTSLNFQVLGDGQCQAGSIMKSPLFRTGTQATSVANGTWTNLNGLTNLGAGLYIVHAYKDNYAGNDWSARGIVEATGHSTIDGDFENQSGFQLRVNGNDVQLYHTLGNTFGITVAWLKIG